MLGRVASQGQNILDDFGLLGGAGRRAVDCRLDVVVPLLKLGGLRIDRHAKLLLHVLAGKLINKLTLGIFFLLVDSQAVDRQTLLQDQVFPAPAPGVVGGSKKNKGDGQHDVHADQGFAKCAHEMLRTSFPCTS